MKPTLFLLISVMLSGSLSGTAAGQTLPTPTTKPSTQFAKEKRKTRSSKAESPPSIGKKIICFVVVAGTAAALTWGWFVYQSPQAPAAPGQRPQQAGSTILSALNPA